MSTKQSEREMCRDLAQRWLNNPPDMMGDPDCDQCALARSYLRALEKIERMTEILNHTKAGNWAHGLRSRIDAELADVWPKAII